MKKYIILLRGINVSGKNKLPMADLRELLNDLGYQNVQTYIQSGNIIIDTDEDKITVCNKIKEAIKKKFRYDVPVVIRTIDEWKRVIENYPFSTDNEKIVAFTFLSEEVSQESLDVSALNDDVYKINKDVVYLNCPTGFGRTKLTNNLFERKLEVTATTRNLRTTLKLLELSKA